MKTKAILYLTSCLALLPPAASAHDAACADADLLLGQMSAKLAAAKSFSFAATREIDTALLEGRDLPEKARISVAVQRPNKLAAHATSNFGSRRVVFDGRTLSLLDERPNVYVSVPMRTSLDGLVEVLDAKYGFTPPLAEFALSNPYAEFHQQAQSVTYLGRGKATMCPLGIFGVECHRLALKGKVADAELWIGVADQLPRKLVATFHRNGQPQVRIAFSSWNLSAPVSANEFVFSPPQGADKIEMWTTAQMASARAKAGVKKN
ncbi:MAG: DUF2092 domain-containing protein [Chthoniobacteraceae bacterium]